MKVIKEGKPIIGCMEVLCPKCEAVLELHSKDLKGTIFRDTYAYTCPCCLRNQIISKSDLSEDVLFDLEHPNK